ncbi:hypothetical protein HanRHA438_Chr13g0606141 [Helianthus annuus]|nr:hypothetical protein HanRHA438_Chr13g0606141 [Helianthus annuus]
MLTCTPADFTQLQTGQLSTLETHSLHTHRCLHGTNNTLDSSFPHFRHHLPLLFLLYHSTSLLSSFLSLPLPS